MRYILLIIINSFLAANIFAAGTVRLHFAGGQAEMGEKLLCPVSVSDFEDILSIQGTISFNASGVELTDIVQFGLPGMSSANFGTTQVDQGLITMTWSDGDLSGESLSDNTILFVLEFTFKQTAAFETTLDFNSAVLPIEVINSDYSEVNLIVFESTIGVGTPNNPDIQLKFSSLQADAGEIVSVPLYVTSAKSSVLSMQGSIQFDPAQLEFAGIGQINIPGFQYKNFGLNDGENGILTFSWNDQNQTGKTFANNENLFVLNFRAIGQVGTEASLSLNSSSLDVEFVSGDYTILSVNTVKGIVEIEDSDNTDRLFLYSEEQELIPGGSVMIPVQVKNFTDIVSMQGSLRFSVSDLNFQSIVPGNIPGLGEANFGTTSSEAGIISFSWSESSLQAVNLNDADTLFLVEFEVLPTSISTILFFDDDPIALEFINSELMEVSIGTGNIFLQVYVPPGFAMLKHDDCWTRLESFQLSHCKNY